MLLARTKKRRTMKYILLAYVEKGKFEGMTKGEQHAMFDECLEYDDHLRANGHSAAEAALQPPKTSSTLYWKNSKVATTDGPYAETNELLGGFFVLEARDNESCCTAHGTASGIEVRQRFRDSASGGHERTDEGKRAAAATEH